MSGIVLPRYPVYVPSKGRPDHRCQTARGLIRDGVPFKLVVEPQEADAYAEKFGRERLLVLPFSNLGSVTPARNWIKDHATAAGHERHWQLDDNMIWCYRLWKRKRRRCPYGTALRICEDFTDRYENIAISGLNYDMFVVPESGAAIPPFYHNVHVYSCSLIWNKLPYRFRPRYNEDTDYCLQALSDGWCTVLVNTVCVKKLQTMIATGGNTDTLRYKAGGRLKMARSLERDWPHVVYVDRRFRRPQHVVRDQWRKFDTPLKLKPGIDLSTLTTNEYGMVFVEQHQLQQPPSTGDRHEQTVAAVTRRTDDAGDVSEVLEGHVEEATRHRREDSTVGVVR